MTNLIHTCFILQYVYYNPLHVSSIIFSSSGSWIVLMLHLVSSLSVSGHLKPRIRLLWLTLRLPWLHSSTTLTEVFPCFFISCKANTEVKLAKMRHGPHSSKLFICVILLLFVLFYVLFVFVLFYVLFVCKCVPYYCHRVLTQLQLKNI